MPRIAWVMVFIALCTAYTLTSSAYGEPVSDSIVLTSLSVSAVTEMLDNVDGLPEGKACLSFPNGLTPSTQTVRSLEAVVTADGYSITDSKKDADVIFTTAVTEARIVIAPQTRGFTRYCSIILHLQCTDREETILYAQSREITETDELESEMIEKTDDSERFSQIAVRHVIDKGSSRKMIGSFLTITVLLIYFAFK